MGELGGGRKGEVEVQGWEDITALVNLLVRLEDELTRDRKISLDSSRQYWLRLCSLWVSGNHLFVVHWSSFGTIRPVASEWCYVRQPSFALSLANVDDSNPIFKLCSGFRIIAVETQGLAILTGVSRMIDGGKPSDNSSNAKVKERRGPR